MATVATATPEKIRIMEQKMTKQKNYIAPNIHRSTKDKTECSAPEEALIVRSSNALVTAVPETPPIHRRP